MYRWLESKRNPKWRDVAALCEDTGYNQISESLYNAYYTGECVEALTLHFIIAVLMCVSLYTLSVAADIQPPMVNYVMF